MSLPDAEVPLSQSKDHLFIRLTCNDLSARVAKYVRGVNSERVVENKSRPNKSCSSHLLNNTLSSIKIPSHSMTYPTDPVNLCPIPPLRDSYSYQSAPHLDEEGWIMGIDEAGRGRLCLLS